MGEGMRRGFIFSLIAIAISGVLLGYSLFLFNSNEEYKNLNLDFLELKKVDFVSGNISSNISNFFDINTVLKNKTVEFEINLNGDKNFFALSSFETFYNNVFENLAGGDLNVNADGLTDGKAEIFFDNHTFEFDYNNKIIKVIPISDLNYILNISVNNYYTSRTVWTYSISGVYVTLNYSDLNGTYSNSGYINGSALCSTNSFTVNYGFDKLKINVCKDNLINGVLVIDGDFSSTYTADVNLDATSNSEIKSAYYNADLNYILNDSKYIGKVHAR
ncbi:MAG: hypothetical protein COT14_03935 [Candidatus Diapherotrites archaeon CG08_land_8_20_14_0_20_30_16]|nr:MAG: hypothetical protein COT14_03935 [Candidatus Diapherotrites archaeon CG08_land_8_20_14_0_20_30_16]